MAHPAVRGERDLLRSLTLPVALAVAAVVAATWYVTWSTADLMMGLLMLPTDPSAGLGLAVAFVLIVVMMVAMMLPAAVPMILGYRGVTRLEGGRPTKAADDVGTLLFIAPYFLVWGLFGLLALVGLMALGWIGPLTGALALFPAATLVAAGAYQLTRTKEVCLRHCQSPTGFVMHHWRSGRAGAFRMGLRHSAYCIGCCWLFMIVLFVAGSMSLLGMGVLSVAIFAEKVGTRPVATSRAIAAILLVLGGITAVRALEVF
jgi:predicted metal-binding membrane protein